MDSGSGSLQSSSGGDEDYDSHHHQQPLFFPPPPLFFNNNNNIPPPPPPPPLISSQQQQQQQPLPFHLPHHNYQNQFHPPPNFYDFPSNFNFHPDSSHNSFLNNPTSLTSEPTADGSTQIPIPPSSSSGVLHPKPTTKKRTRASRRAPTTILTTDTTNFRAMVQEFTGIPSPPFTAGGSTSYSSRRFDLFGSLNLEAASGSGSGSGLYPSRSSKVQLFSSLSNENVAVAVEDQNVSNLQQQQRAQAGIFSFRSLSEGSHLEQPHIHGSSSSQQLVSALQNDETWRANGGGTAATATATHSNNNNAAAGNCKLNFTGSSSSSSMNNLQRDKEMLLGNIIVSTTTTRGENTVDSWIYPSD